MTIQETTSGKQQQGQRDLEANNKQASNIANTREGAQFNSYPPFYYNYGTARATRGTTFVPDSFSSDSTKLDLKKQLEYYFSRQNLANDTYLVSQMDSEEYVPITLIAGFRRVREQTSDLKYITDLLRSSSAVIVDETGTRVKPNIAVQRSTVILRDMPESTTLEEVNDLLNVLDSPPIKSVKQDVGSMWYVALRSEEDAVKLLFSIKGRTFKDKPISARIKSEPIFKPRSTTITTTSATTVEPSQSILPIQPYGYYYANTIQQLPQQLHQHYLQQKPTYYHRSKYQNNHHQQHVQHSQQQQQQQQQNHQHKNRSHIKENHQNNNRYENHHHQKHDRHNDTRNQPTPELLTNNVANISINNNKKQQNYSNNNNGNNNDNKSSRINTGDNNAHANSNTKNINANTSSNNTSNSKNKSNNTNNDNSLSKKYNNNNKQGNKQHKKNIRQDRKKSGKQAELMQSSFPPLSNQKVSREGSITVDPVTQEKHVVQEQEPMGKSFSYAEMLKKKK